MKYFVIAGEASGDLHASNLIAAINQLDTNAEIRGCGGDLMQAKGCELLMHYRDMAFMGIFEVLANIRTIGKNFKRCQEELLRWRPDVLILVDYPGFNLRMAHFAKQNGIKTCYYISPKIWAWKQSRIHKIKADVDKMLCILPFEIDFYKGHHYPITYVGNPVLDAIDDRKPSLPTPSEFKAKHGLDERPLIAILAGSRKQELKQCLPRMVDAALRFPDFQFVVAGALSLDRNSYNKYLNGTGIGLVYNETYELLNASDAAIVTSGTATLETALMGIPQVVVYRTSPATYIVGTHIITVPKYFSLPNLIANRTVVKELLQYNLPKDISYELGKIMYDDEYRAEMLRGYAEIREKIGPSGTHLRAAEEVVKMLTAQSN
jgi:lipid-A-disaccharide synthase